MISQRNHALDFLRGITILLMVVVNNQGDWTHVYPLLRHATWHGFLGADIVFPLFLFVAGYAAALKIERTNTIASAYFLSLSRRAALLFSIGLFLNGWPFGILGGTEFHLSTLRLLGVLQRIALCVFFGGVILWHIRSVRITILSVACLFIFYEIGMRVCIGEYNGQRFGQSFELFTNYARFVDTALLPERMLYRVQGIPFDPEGLFTTLTATASFLLGALCFRMKKGRLLATAILFFMVAAILPVEPINKQLWTLPYTLLTGATAFLLLTMLERLKWDVPHFWQRPILAMGKNPLMLYALSVLIAKTLALGKVSDNLSLKAHIYGAFTQLPITPETASLCYALFLVFVVVWMARLLRGVSLTAR
ncbi:MAG TPA: heparan-alpha-glucosaminide N-acetyltransferase domain-containing protein [Turneriella sp.]|nr:heparan-alpha-glucosaminide N-acetyltransferase domain-containing protein [Turneriella sp.]